MVSEDRYAMVDSYEKEIHFTDEQKKCIDYDSDTALVIKGTAGSGKSLMVIKRAKDYREEIIQSGQEKTVCVMTYTKTLAQGIRDVLEKNGISIRSPWTSTQCLGDEDMVSDQYLFVTNVDSYLVSLCRQLGTRSKKGGFSGDFSHGYNYKYNHEAKSVVKDDQITDEQRVETVRRVLLDLSKREDHPYYHRNPEFWADEISWMYQNGIVDDDDEEEYLNINREGRCKRYNVHMSRAGRKVAFKIFVNYNRLLVKNNHTEWDREYAIFLRRMDGKIPREYKFDYLLIDEAQDLSLVKMKILKQLCKEELNIAMDKNQSIYGHRWSFKKDLDLTVHVKKLSVMFRGTKEIDEFSADLKKVDDTLLDEEDIYLNETSDRVTNILPKIVKCFDAASEMDFIVNEAEVLTKNPNSNVAILCLDYKHLYQFRDALRKKGVPTQFFRDDDFRPLTGGVKLITTYSAKGLGFINVIIPYFTEGVYPKSVENIISSLVENPDERSEGIDFDDAIEEEISGARRLIYVGITRARANIILTYSQKPSRFINEFNPAHYKLINESHTVVSDDQIHYTPFKVQTEAQTLDSIHTVVHADTGGVCEGNYQDDLLKMLVEAGVEFVDRREKNGTLWIIDGPKTRASIHELEDLGYRFGFTPRGSRSTDHRPAYYYDG